MKRSMFGVILLAATGLWSCKGDPTESIRAGEKVIADPTAVFLDQGANKSVVVQLVDGQGDQLAADFEAQNVGAGITVAKDPTYLQTTNGSRIPTSERFIITAVSPAATSFDVVAGTATLTIPVKVIPTSFGATFSNAAPAQNEPVTITAPSGFKFTPEAAVVFGVDTAVVVARAADSSSITFVPGPASAPLPSAATVIGVLSDIAPTAPLTIPTADALTIPAAAALSGTDAPGTAPAIPLPAAGQTTATFDVPDFAATIDHFYKLNVTEAGDYTVTVDWTIGNDLDAPVCIADPTCASEDFLDPTVSGNKPESGTFTLPVGTSVLWVEDFGAIQHLFPPFAPGTAAIGARLKIVISH